ncbi:ATP-binding protein [Alkalicella caledoniensis]|uniref:ATP-binding protein n=1 Tax=Alkalicella caledoniensis TaxID=2731377 RepID=A0A7G9W4X5_ALKCA|nr:IS21-like element helper ATPase IstB [Alkalicella caledoniensis]QNO13737.1 ATP-binding protein [Alkalicella caledoniensis]
MENIKDKLTTCKLAGIQKSYELILEEARQNNMSYEDFFERLLDEELLSRDNNRFNRLMKKANFPNIKTLEQFNYARAPFVKKTDIASYAALEFIEQRKNIIFIGVQGTGKTHLSIGLGVEACKKGKSVLFTSAASLGNRLSEAQNENVMSKFLDRIKKVDLLIIDELGYVELPAATTNLMFQIFSERYEKGSIIVTTNLEFGEWTKVFHDQRMTTAIIDRLIHNCKIFSFDGPSYRLNDHVNLKSNSLKI